MKARILGAAILLLTALAVPTIAAAAPTADTRQSASVAVFTQFDATLQPGVLHGFILGPSSEHRAYYAEVTPTEPGSADGAFIERNVVEPEFNATASVWIDVLRLQIPTFMTQLNVHVRVYSLTPRR